VIHLLRKKFSSSNEIFVKVDGCPDHPRSSRGQASGHDAERFSSLLPLWEKVARTQSAPDEGFVSAERTPHPSSLREATLSHKGRGEEHTRGATAHSIQADRDLEKTFSLRDA